MIKENGTFIHELLASTCNRYMLDIRVKINFDVLFHYIKG